MATIELQGVPHGYDLTDSRDSPVVLVFVHGWLLSRHYWQPVIDAIAPQYQCLTYDLRGFGSSQPIPKPAASMRSYRLRDYAKDLVLLLEQLQIEHAWLVGHSLGGSIALWAADLMPQRVQGVICVNAGGGIYLKEEFERFRSAGQQLVKLRPRWLCDLPLVDLMFTRMNVATAIDRQWGRQRLVDFVAADAAAAIGSLLESTTEAEVHRLPQIVARLQQPVYFIAGADDTVMEPKYVHHLASFHPLFECYGANIVEIPNCGHLAMVEQPGMVSRTILEILQRQPER